MLHNIIIAIVASIVNLILSLTLPLLLHNAQTPLLIRIKQNYLNNKNTLLINTICVFAFVYVSLIISPTVEQNILSKIASLNVTQNLVK
jgi:hypothetical protein